MEQYKLLFDSTDKRNEYISNPGREFTMQVFQQPIKVSADSIAVTAEVKYTIPGETQKTSYFEGMTPELDKDFTKWNSNLFYETIRSYYILKYGFDCVDVITYTNENAMSNYAEEY
jgi:hypothetical protein